MPKALSLTLALSGLTLALFSRARQSAPPPASPEMTRLREALSGTWSLTLQVEPSAKLPQGGEGRGQEVWRSGPGSLSLIEEYHAIGTEGEISGLGITWWDQAAQTYQRTWCESTNADGCLVTPHGARWEGSQLLLREERPSQGKMVSVTEVFSDLTPTSFQQTLYEGEAGGEFRKTVSIRATRMKPDAGHTRVPSPLWPVGQIRRLRMPGPAVQNSMLGTWSIRVKEEASAQRLTGGTGQGTEVWWPGPGGYSVIEEYYQNDAHQQIEAFSPAWWEVAAGGQRFVWCSNTVPSGCVLSKNVAQWEDHRSVYTEEREEGGKKVISREIFKDISPRSFTQVIQQGASGGELRTVRTIRATKVSDKATLFL